MNHKDIPAEVAAWKLSELRPKPAEQSIFIELPIPERAPRQEPEQDSDGGVTVVDFTVTETVLDMC